MRSFTGDAGIRVPRTGDVRRYVFEPHAAVLAAGLSGAIAVEHGLAPVTGCGGYLTGDVPVADLALTAFEVQDVLALDERRLKRHLRERCIGRVEVKKRGVDLEPARLESKLRGPGDERAVLLVARLDARVVAIVARRIENWGSGVE